MKRGLRHDPKVIAISRELADNRAFMAWWSNPQQMSCRENVTEIVTFANVTRITVASLLDVWSSLNNSIGEDGIMPFMTPQDVDDMAEVPGLGDAMISVGWIIEHADGGLEFPNFTKNNTPSKSRSQPKTAAQRAKEYRERKKAESEASQSSRHVTREKRREEKSIKKEAKASCPASPDVLEKIWGMVPQISRTRSSQVKVKKAWDKIKPADKPSLETLTEALEAWKTTEKWREGYAEGLHIWINDRQWLNLPTPEPDTKPSGTREMQFGARTGHVTKL